MSSQLSREELLRKVEEDAARCERELHGCGRCTLSALMKHLDLGDQASADLALKAVLPLSGGIAQTRNTCGALLGGLMAIGMVSFPGRLDDATMDDIRAAMTVGRKFYRRFEKEIGHARCFDIREAALGRVYDTSDPDEYRKFAEAGGYQMCGDVCGKAARLAAEFVLDIRDSQTAA